MQPQGAPAVLRCWEFTTLYKEFHLHPCGVIPVFQAETLKRCSTIGPKDSGIWDVLVHFAQFCGGNEDYSFFLIIVLFLAL